MDKNIVKDDKKNAWFDGEKYIPFSELTNEHLQNAFTRCQKKVLYWYNRANVFDELAEKLELEAERRGITLKEVDAEFYKRNKKLKNAIKK